MAAKPLSTEAIALTEKKMDMTLDDIIRMSKNTSKTKRQKRVPNKGQKFSNGLTQDKSSKLRRFMDSRSSVRQGVLAKRRSNFQENQFPVAAQFAQKAAVAPLRNRASNRSRMANQNKARFGAPAGQRRAASGNFAPKPRPTSQQQQREEELDVMPKQRPQTLDSLFANMKEQRMRGLSRPNNNVHRNGGSGPRIPPWGRSRFGN
ncbi:uncharacterized protein LOC114731714 isoform X2 [Neltuma alba]|uniref:uncharacterized protein LOC114731714 isoform X2 n=1 Tax=Neltuma alba TaxID=207710 RepID=UPI0010A45D86|nr:uncharacterized protein LOC114731714 isoform X2 [Prosopis alba]